VVPWQQVVVVAVTVVGSGGREDGVWVDSSSRGGLVALAGSEEAVRVHTLHCEIGIWLVDQVLVFQAAR
jgi:hypothetical protein